MRSAGGTNLGLPCVVVACTNSTIACLAGPSFHEGSGSAAFAKFTNTSSRVMLFKRIPIELSPRWKLFRW